MGISLRSSESRKYLTPSQLPTKLGLLSNSLVELFTSRSRTRSKHVDGMLFETATGAHTPRPPSRHASDGH